MPGISLPDLVQKIKIDTKDMSIAAQRATKFGTDMLKMSKDIDDASKRWQQSLDNINKDMDSNLRSTRDSQRDVAREFGNSTRLVDQFAASINRLPGSKTTKIDTDWDQAGFDRIKSGLNSMPSQRDIIFHAKWGTQMGGSDTTLLKIKEQLNSIPRSLTTFIGIDAKEAERKLARLNAEIRKSRPEIGVGLTVDDYEYRALQARLKAAQLEVGVEADLKTAKIKAQMDALEKKRQVEIEADLSGEKVAEAKLNTVARDRHSKIHVSTDKNNLQQIINELGTISGLLSGMGSAGGFAFLAKLALPAGILAGVQALVPLVGALGGSLVQLSQAALVAPAGLSALGAAIGPVVLGLKGMTEATDKWTVNFRDKMEAVGNQWDKLRLTLRKDLLKNVATEMSNFSKKAIPQLTDSFRGIAQAWNGVATGMLKWAGSDKTLNSIKTILKATEPIIQSMGKGLQFFGDAFLGLSKAGMPVMQRLGDAFTNLMKQFDAWVTKSSKGGGLTKMMNDGVDAVKRLWGVVTTLGDAINGMFGSAKMAGIDFIDWMQGIATWLNTFFNSPVIQRGFADAFVGVRELIGGIFGAMGPLNTIFAALGKVTKDVGVNLGAVAKTTLPYLAAGFQNLAPAISAIVNTMAPFQEVINAIGPSFVRATSAVSAFAKDVAAFVGGAVKSFAPAIETISETVADLLPKAFALGKAAMDAFQKAIAFVAPTLAQLAQDFGPLVGNLLDFATALIRATGPLLPIVAGLWALQKVMVAVKTAFLGMEIVKTVGVGLASFGSALSGVPMGVKAAQMSGLAKATVGMGTAMGGLAAGTPVLGKFATGMGKLGEMAATGATKGAIFKTAVGGMLTALAPAAITLAVVGGAFAIYSANAEAAARKTQELTTTLNQQTGNATASTLLAVRKELSTAMPPQAWEGLDKVGLGADKAAAALIKGSEAWQTYLAAVREATKEELANKGPDALPKWKGLAEAAVTVRERLAAARREVIDNVNAQEAMERAGVGLAQGLKEVRDAAEGTTTKIRTYSDVLGQMNNPMLTARQAQRDYKDALQESAVGAKAWLKEHGSMKGALNENTEAGRQNVAMLDRIAQSAAADVLAAEARGASQGELTKKLNDARTALTNQAKAWGMAPTEIQKYVDSVLGVPSEVGTEIYVWSDAAKQAIANFNTALAALPPETMLYVDAQGNVISVIDGIADNMGKLPKNTKLVVDADGRPAIVAIQSIDAEVKAIPKGAHISVTADGSKAVVEMNGVTTTFGQLPDGKQFYLRADGTLAIGTIEEVNRMKMNDKNLKATADSTDATTKLKAVNDTELRRKIARADGDVTRAMADLNTVQYYKLANKTVYVSAAIAKATSDIEYLKRMLRAIPDEQVNITINKIERVIRGVTYGDQARADGGIDNGRGVLRFAAGGIEDHRPQIVRSASPFRMWAEPETGGEAYIPLGMQKRRRAREVWLEAAKYLGFDVGLIRSVLQMDTGGILTQRLATMMQTQRETAAPARIGTTSTPASVQPVAPVEKHYHFLFNVSNPVAETTSETVTKQMTRLGTLGVFGG